MKALTEIMQRECDEALAAAADRMEKALVEGPVPAWLKNLPPRRRLTEEQIRMIFLRTTPSWMWP